MDSFEQPYSPSFSQHPSTKSRKKLWIILSIVIGISTVLIICCAVVVIMIGFILKPNPASDKNTNKAKSQVFKLPDKWETKLVNSEPDYGLTMTVAIKNVGESGDIEITPSLSCSEGQWKRNQHLHFEAGESKTLTYFFQEPTINAANCESNVQVSP